ncbi:MAG: hypothetical protein ACI87W_001967 [Halieaceae bacterium]|jgi:hypothetical protein
MLFRFGVLALWAMTPRVCLAQLQLGFSGRLPLLPALLFALVSCSAMFSEALIARRLTLPSSGDCQRDTLRSTQFSGCRIFTGINRLGKSVSPTARVGMTMPSLTGCSR